ncbi:MAG: hypothetical protein IKS71_05190 [Bacteroidales bacterium]|nr:hypothetical protein [Bacteroidales bacterium]
MEKTAKEVFNEIQTTIARLRAQLDELEEKLALVVIPDDEQESVEEPEPLADEIPDQVGDDIPEEPLGIEVVEEVVPLAVENDAEPEHVVIPSEVEESPEEPIDLSIDMSELGAKTMPDAKNYQWMIDLPGGPVANVISAISLNDRVLFINTLFKEDPSLFQQTIAAFNEMESINEAVSYVIANFPDWNLNSEVVYRLMMAVRRKLK